MMMTTEKKAQKICEKQINKHFASKKKEPTDIADEYLCSFYSIIFKLFISLFSFVLCCSKRNAYFFVQSFMMAARCCSEIGARRCIYLVKKFYRTTFTDVII